jgi:hypothetical protein
LLELAGDVDEALELMLRRLESDLMEIKTRMRAGEDGLEEVVGRLGKVLNASLDLCQRNEGGEEGKEGVLYFIVLDRLMHLKTFLGMGEGGGGGGEERLAAVLHDLLHQLVLRIVSSNSSIVLANIVERVTMAGNVLGDFRDILEAIMESCIFEVNVCDAAEVVVMEGMVELKREKEREELRGMRGEDVGVRAVGKGGRGTGGGRRKGRGGSGDSGWLGRRGGRYRKFGWKGGRGGGGEGGAGKLRFVGGGDINQPTFVGGEV